MQDLGRIVIDINEKGSAKAEGISGVGEMAGAEGGAEAAAAASEEIGALASAAGFASVAFTAVAGVFTVLTKVVGEVGKALLALNRFVLEVASDLHDYSPGIQLAEMQNQIAMMMTRFRSGSQVGGAIGAQMLEVGRIDRALAETKATLAGIAAVFLRPITKLIADMLDYIKAGIPKIIEMIAAFMDGLGRLFDGIAQASNAFMLPSWLSSSATQLSKVFFQIGIDLRAIKRNTDPKIDYGAINQPFLADLKLMGMKGI